MEERIVCPFAVRSFFSFSRDKRVFSSFAISANARSFSMPKSLSYIFENSSELLAFSRFFCALVAAKVLLLSYSLLYSSCSEEPVFSSSVTAARSNISLFFQFESIPLMYAVGDPFPADIFAASRIISSEKFQLFHSARFSLSHGVGRRFIPQVRSIFLRNSSVAFSRSK